MTIGTLSITDNYILGLSMLTSVGSSSQDGDAFPSLHINDTLVMAGRLELHMDPLLMAPANVTANDTRWTLITFDVAADMYVTLSPVPFTSSVSHTHILVVSL